MAQYRFKCTVDASHKFSQDVRHGAAKLTSGQGCPEPGCAGCLDWQVNPKKRSPGSYETKADAYVDLRARIEGVRRRAETVRAPSDKNVKKRKFDEAMAAKVDAQVEAESASAPRAKLIKLDHTPTVDEDDPDYVGAVAFNPETRLSGQSLCNPFAAVVLTPTACQLKCSGIFSTNVDVKGGRINARSVMGKSASRAMQDAAHTDVPDCKCVTNRNNQHGEWCHLQADSLGGKSVPTNFVAARFAANTFMMVIEHAVAKQPYFAKVEAHGDLGVNEQTPLLIKYHLWRSDPTIGALGAIPAPHLTFLISPSTKSFTRENQVDVHDRLRRAHFDRINPLA